MSLKRSCDHLDSGQPPPVETVNENNGSSTNQGDTSVDSECRCDGHGIKDNTEVTTKSEVPDDKGPLAVSETIEKLDLTVNFMKENHKISIAPNETVGQLKQLLQEKVGVPVATQKLLYKGKPTDNMTLNEWGVKSGSKMMLIGTRVEEILDVQVPTGSSVVKDDEDTTKESKEPLSKQKPHAKVMEKGKPDDAMMAFKGLDAPLPVEPLSGMVNKSGGKVRLTFKLEQDQLWIGTKERTEKVNMTSVRAIVSEPIDGHEEYHMMAIQLGPTEASRYWIYWVPAQYVKAIKRTILGD